MYYVLYLQILHFYLVGQLLVIASTDIKRYSNFVNLCMISENLHACLLLLCYYKLINLKWSFWDCILVNFVDAPFMNLTGWDGMLADIWWNMYKLPALDITVLEVKVHITKGSVLLKDISNVRIVLHNVISKMHGNSHQRRKIDCFWELSEMFYTEEKSDKPSENSY